MCVEMGRYRGEVKPRGREIKQKLGVPIIRRPPREEPAAPLLKRLLESDVLRRSRIERRIRLRFVLRVLGFGVRCWCFSAEKAAGARSEVSQDGEKGLQRKASR